MFVDDTCIFSTVFDINKSSNELNKDLHLISKWAFQWEMSFNLDPNKQATEVTFPRKRTQENHPVLVFNNSPVMSLDFQKHLGLFLDRKLNFNHHLKENISKSNKGIGLIRRLYHKWPRKSLLTIYKSFIRPHLDYGDVIYHQPHNEVFTNKIESVQYNAALAITGAIKGTSRERLYQELGLESLCDRRWYRRLILFFNIIKNKSPSYLKNYLPSLQFSYNINRSNLFNRYCKLFFPIICKRMEQTQSRN